MLKCRFEAGLLCCSLAVALQAVANAGGYNPSLPSLNRTVTNSSGNISVTTIVNSPISYSFNGGWYMPYSGLLDGGDGLDGFHQYPGPSGTGYLAPQYAFSVTVNPTTAITTQPTYNETVTFEYDYYQAEYLSVGGSQMGPSAGACVSGFTDDDFGASHPSILNTDSTKVTPDPVIAAQSCGNSGYAGGWPSEVPVFPPSGWQNISCVQGTNTTLCAVGGTCQPLCSAYGWSGASIVHQTITVVCSPVFNSQYNDWYFRGTSASVTIPSISGEYAQIAISGSGQGTPAYESGGSADAQNGVTPLALGSTITATP